MAANESVLNALLARGDTMKSYTPTLRERVVDALARNWFGDNREGVQQAEKVSNLLETATPYGMATMAYDAGRAGGSGDYLGAGLMGAMAALPMPAPMEQEAKQGIRAFHGSPHSFDRFSMDKIGTGEGAQAYGHGLYFAERENTARGYRNAVSAQRGAGPKIDGQEVDYNDPRYIAKAWTQNFGGDTSKAIQYLENIPASAKSEGTAEAIRMLKSGEPIPDYTPAGHMYEVRINANPDDFLDWDKPLSEQPKGVQKAVKEIGLDSPGWVKGGDIHEHLGNYVGNYANSDVGVSELLKKHKVPGIKYLDAGSRGKGDGSRNYVVFDDKLIEIVKKYGIAGASTMLGLDIMSHMNDAQAATLKQADAAAQFHNLLMGAK